MKIPRKISVVIFIMAAAGLSLFIILLVRHNIGNVLAAAAQAGWGILAVFAGHAFARLFDTLSWRALLPKEHRPSVWRLLLIHWIGDSVSAMLPVAQVGGEIIRVQMLSKTHGADGRPVPLPVATSSVLVGMTVSLATQIVFLLSGLVLLVMLTGQHGLTVPILVAAGLSGLGGAGFYAVQRAGMFRVATKLIARVAKGVEWAGLVRTGAELDADVRACYARRGAVWECAGWNMCCWGAGALEIWAALWALDLPGGYATAYTLESIAQGIRSAVFLVPGALGFQEGGYLGIGRLLGISSTGALALSLIRRVRELAFGIPGLIVWQALAGRRLWFRRPEVATLTPLADKAP
jgi:putative membrane protein